MSPNHDLDPITAQLRSEETKMRRRVLWLTLIPVVVAGVLIWVTARQVATAERQATEAEERVAFATDSLAQVRDELQATTQEILRRHAEIDSLEALAEAYYDELETVDQARAVTARDRAITAFQAYQARNRVYIHVLTEAQRRPVSRLQSALEDGGFIVPEVELVERGPDVSELRFFRAEDGPAAKEIVDIAGRLGLQLQLRDLSRTYGESGSVAAGTFEIWMGAGRRGG